MKNALHTLIIATCAVFTAHGNPVEVTNEKQLETTEVKVEASHPAWSYSGVELKKGDSAVITATGRWTVIPDRGQWDAAGQNDNERAGGRSMAPGKHLGSLLVRVGESNADIREMERAPDGSVKPMSVSATNDSVKIYFVANDEPPDLNTNQIIGIVIGGKYAYGHAGFDDNAGALTVAFKITRVIPLITESR